MAILTVPSDADLDALLGAYDLGEKRSATGIEAGTVNTSYALEMSHGRFFLRIYEEQPQAGAETEARLLLHLAASGVPTPPPVQAKDGSMVHVLSGKPAVIFPWVPGEMLCLKAVTPAAASVSRSRACTSPVRRSPSRRRSAPGDSAPTISCSVATAWPSRRTRSPACSPSRCATP